MIFDTLRPTYDIYTHWYSYPDTAEQNTNWSILSNVETDDSIYLYKWVSGSYWFDDPDVYLCNSYPVPVGLSNPSILISVRAKAIPVNWLLVGTSTLRVYYYESEEDNYFTDFVLGNTWVTHQIEIPFDWGVNPITKIRFKARINKYTSNLYISQMYFDLLGQ